ncbi:hypothetical protein FHT00_002307 [Sphingomonas insulae]|uniref:Uncharacterized protein n=1 Tax=Sphingomonas insulae TaxID=424800 RepID=A0ABN1HKY5_9SPHN|nr:hypothetical protein [Sphingomonas insulae]NIJ30344.1 hypothetical protein [Sphingomonas insulae]
MSDKDERAARLAAQLRANLHRRKAQARAGVAAPAPAQPPADVADHPVGIDRVDDGAGGDGPHPGTTRT